MTRPFPLIPFLYFHYVCPSIPSTPFPLLRLPPFLLCFHYVYFPTARHHRLEHCSVDLNYHSCPQFNALMLLAFNLLAPMAIACFTETLSLAVWRVQYVWRV